MQKRLKDPVLYVVIQGASGEEKLGHHKEATQACVLDTNYSQLCATDPETFTDLSSNLVYSRILKMHLCKKALKK